MTGIFVDEHYIEIFAILPALILLAGMLFAVWIDPYIQKADRVIMFIIGALVFSLIAENFFDYLLGAGTSNVFLRRIVDIYGYSIRPVILLLFMHIT